MEWWSLWGIIIAVIIVILFLENKMSKKKSASVIKVDIPEEVFLVAEENGHRNPEDFAVSVYWANKIIRNKDDYVILDTETTGLNKNDVVVQVGIIDVEGNTLLDSLIRPSQRKRIPKAATDIHGISIEDLTDAPPFHQVAVKIKEACADKTVVIYNSDYDIDLLDQTAEQEGVAPINFANTFCAMKLYSKFKGQWNSYYGEYRWQKLPSGDHSAVGDCQATLKLLQKMASVWPENEKFS